MHNDMLVTMNGSKSKLEVEFQYSGRPFSLTGSNNNSAVDRDRYLIENWCADKFGHP